VSAPIQLDAAGDSCAQHGPIARPKLWLLGRIAAVGAQLAAEKLSRPIARTAEDVPRSGQTVTREWLTAVVCRDHPGAEVVSFETPGGSCGTSTRTALRLSYNDAGQEAGLPTELFTKCSTTFSQRILLGGARVLDGEVAYYTAFRPLVDMEAPHGYWGAWDPRSWRSVVLIEDVAATKGATFVDPTTELTRAQIEDLLAGMAAYHGAFWASDLIRMLKTPSDHFRNISQFINMESRVKVGARRAADLIPAPLRGRDDELWRAVRQSLELATAQPRTLLHGDSHVGQTYVTAAGRMGLTDWQVTQQGSWGYDFAYLVNSALGVDQRRAWDRELLAFYLDRLAAAGGAAPTFDDAWLTYRQQAFYPYAAWTFTIGRAAYQPRMQPESVCRPIIERLAHAIDDLESLKAMHHGG
jgi:hypothetical protein